MRCHLPQCKYQLLRQFSVSRPNHYSWSPGPAPPRLPKEDQETFERLRRQSTGAFSIPRESTPVQQSPHSRANDQPEQATSSHASDGNSQRVEKERSSPLSVRADVQPGDELHPNVRRGAPPEFKGDMNPKTGEVGGPKNEPLRWGQGGDWSYNGRVSDF